MRALIIYSGQSKRMKAIVEVISSAIQSKGDEVKEVKAERSGEVTSLFIYDLVYVGSPVLGFWGGKFPEPLASYIKNSSGLEGKKTAVFVTPRVIGVTRTLRRIMKLLEGKGSIVIAFRTIKNLPQAKDFGKILYRI
ncbi:hypothetical protein KAV79_04085 [Candidatus Aerophobetes bacterium]|nr:hypothetical protein [Candidatus Aerophobetes bacterium]